MIIKTQISKLGEIKEYVGKPVYDFIPVNATDNPKVIGEITDIKELDYNYELTIELNGHLQLAWADQKGSELRRVGFKLN